MRRWFILAALLGCGQKLDRYNQVHDLRVLAVQASPPEIQFDNAPDHVDFTALVVDPEGAPVTLDWSVCPIESHRACLDFDETVERVGQAFDDGTASIDFSRALRDARAIHQSSTVEPAAPPAPDDPRLMPYAEVPFQLAVSDLLPLQTYYATVGFFGIGMGSWPSVLLQASSASDSLSVEKRFVVGIGDPFPYDNLIADALGFHLCAPGVDPTDEAPCVPFRAHAANTNPVFADPPFGYAYSKRSDVTFLDPPVSAILTLPVGESIRIEPRFTPESSEAYQFIRASLETGVVEVVDAVEEISVSWFFTEGGVQDPLTWPKFTRTLDTAYTAPDKVPEKNGGIVTLFLVARDQRGGEAWQRIDLQITE